MAPLKLSLSGALTCTDLLDISSKRLTIVQSCVCQLQRLCPCMYPPFFLISKSAAMCCRQIKPSEVDLTQLQLAAKDDTSAPGPGSNVQAKSSVEAGRGQNDQEAKADQPQQVVESPQITTSPGLRRGRSAGVRQWLPEPTRAFGFPCIIVVYLEIMLVS